ncbi:MAG: HEAT repeat domain-containing protein, partial [Myxococcales bacterium]|nr:HEAT repeat domain-containing protein [Myxococcales bacterium]
MARAKKSTRGLALIGAVLALTLLLSEAIGGRWAGDTRDEVLGKLSADAQILINLDASDLPSTTDMIRLGRQATPAIINGLVNSMNAEVRAACAAVLTGTRDPRAVTALLDALEDPRYDVRSLAIKALGQLESRDATMRLLALLDKPGTSEGIKEEALAALGRLGDPRAVPRLIVYFERTWHQAAQAALWDLRRHLSKDQVARLAVAPLAAGTASEPPPYDVLAEAIQLAARLEIRAARPHLERLYPVHEGLQNKIIFALGRLGDAKAVPFLKKLLDPASPARVLNNVAFALDRLGQDVTPFLQEALGDRRAYIRFNAAFVAGDLKKAALVPALTRALTDANDFVRSNAAVALGTIADASARPALEAASHEKNPVVRGDALLALAAIDYPGTRARLLAEGITSDHPGTRNKAVEFLVARGDESIIDPVLEVLSPDNYRDRALGLSLLGSFDALKHPAATAFLLR